MPTVPQQGRLPTARRGGRRAYAYVVAVLWLVPALAVAVGHSVLSGRPPAGRCDGLGWGCTLSPAEGIVLIGLVAALPLLLAGVLALVVLAVLRRPARGSHRWSPAGQATAAVVAGSVAAGVLTVLVGLLRVVTG